MNLRKKRGRGASGASGASLFFCSFFPLFFPFRVFSSSFSSLKERLRRSFKTLIEIDWARPTHHKQPISHRKKKIFNLRSGVADRGASIRIPLPVQLAQKGYLEDRRPAANVDPYTVARLLIKSTMK